MCLSKNQNRKIMDSICFNISAFIFILCFFITDAYAQHHDKGHDSPVIMENIVVTADRIEEYMQKYPQQVTMINREEILERNFLNVEETLNSMPGVEVRSSAGIGSRISIRGSGKAGGVLVLLNGRPLNSSQYGGVDLSSIPIDIIKSVTVFKPPVPVWLGPGSGDGAISIITHDFQAKTGDKKEKKKASTRIKLSSGSYGLAEGNLSHNVPLSDGSVMLTAAGTHKDGKRTNSDRDKGVFSLHWDHKTKSALQYDVNSRYYFSEYGSSGPVDNPTPDARQRYEKGALDIQSRGFAGENGDYSFKGYADKVKLKDEAQSGLTSDLDSLKLGIKADTSWSEEQGIWTLRVGGIMERDDADHTITGDHHRVTAGLHTQYDRHFGKAAATIGIRADNTSDFDINPGFSGGISYSLSGKSLIKANMGYTVNIPSFGQLYQPAHGSYDQVRGNPDLDEEKIWSYDLGAEYRFGKDKMIQASLFRTDSRDLIVYLRGDDLIYRPVNTDKSWRHGIEFSFKYAWDKGLELDINYIIQDSENRETGKELAYTPAHKFKTTLKYTLPKINTRIEAALQYEAERFSEAEGKKSQKLDDFITINIKAVQPFVIKKIPLEFFLNIYNLFNSDFEFHNGYPDEGIRFISGVNITF